jgi:protein arginine kinase activator
MSTCDFCDQPAIFHDVRIVNGVHTTKNLCQEHAIAEGIQIGPLDLSMVVNLQIDEQAEQNILRCSDCGMTIAQYKETRLLGCPTCYETFAEQLKHFIAQVQDNHSLHIGRSPSSEGTDIGRHLEVRRLLKQLDNAVTQEDYENAAHLRDRIRELHDGSDVHDN